ncbi:hypothetical protein IY230_02295 [Acholeplasma laidlawii]|uniref:hypothetical protein n=1 Tax=Acholeplasma laidlawii TaxID=2148 RepID=UPI0018C2428D|nr:hypothetical protein [Acholeplasma laidlawii]MBG0762443.1 hypothetical protein [Acholeplasma laidlawii]
MKKIYTLFILISTLLLSGCIISKDDEPKSYEVGLDILYELNDEVRGLDIIVDLNMAFDVSEVTDFYITLSYMVNATTEDLDYKLQLPSATKINFFEVTGNQAVLTLEEVIFDYKGDYISAYATVQFKKGVTNYMYELKSIKTTNLYELALVSEGTFATEILESLKPNTEFPELEISLAASLNNEFRGFDLNAVVSSNDTLESLEVTYGFIYILNSAETIYLNTPGVTNISMEEVATLDLLTNFNTKFKNTTLDYVLDRVYARSFITVTKEDEAYTYYSEIINFTLYELALESTGAFAEEIITEVEYQEPDQTVLTLISVSANTSNYTITLVSDHTTATISTDYLKVTVVVTLDPGYSFSNSVIFKFNNKVVSALNYTIVNDKLTYTFNDPNWSGIY